MINLYSPNLLARVLLHRLVRDFTFWLHAYLSIFFNCVKFQQDWTKLISNIL